MAIETAADVLGMFDTADHAEAGAYTATGEAALTVSVILDREEAPIGGIGMSGTGWRAMVPASQIPDRPQPGETLSVGTRDFIIEAAEADMTGAVWTLTLRKAGAWL